MVPVRELPYGPAAPYGRIMRPDRWQHPTTRQKATNPLASPGASTDDPIKPGTARHAHADWDALLNRIAQKRFLVVTTPNKSGGMTYSIPSLSNAERDLLNADRFALRSNGRLGSIYENQRLEIDRVVRWIATQGRNPSALILIDRSAKFGSAAPDSIKKLMTAWRTSEEVGTALRQESTRRIVEQERARENALPMPDGHEHLERTPEQLQRVLDGQYPDPDFIRSPLVKAFSTALRSQSSTDAEIESLARQISESYATREAVMQYGPELAAAYSYHLKGSSSRAGETERAGRTGRGQGHGR